LRRWSHEHVKEVLPQVRERAVRLVQEHRGEYPSQWAEIDSGELECVTTAEAQRVKELEREVKQLRRANAILKLVSAFFAQRSSTAV